MSAFEATFSEANTLKKLIDSVKDLISDVNLDITPQGLSLQSMDSAHVALVSLTLSKDGFHKYKAEKPMTIGLSISNLGKVLKLANQDDKLTLRSKDNDSSLEIVFENDRQNKKTEFLLNLISLDSDHMGVPEQGLSSEIAMNSYDFSKLCKELHSLSETVNIRASSSFVQFAVDGEIGSGKVRIETGDPKKDENPEGDINLSFALRYLNMFNKASPLSNYVKLLLSNEAPLVVEYSIDKYGTLRYYLAPKVNEDAQC